MSVTAYGVGTGVLLGIGAGVLLGAEVAEGVGLILGVSVADGDAIIGAGLAVRIGVGVGLGVGMGINNGDGIGDGDSKAGADGLAGGLGGKLTVNGVSNDGKTEAEAATPNVSAPSNPLRRGGTSQSNLPVENPFSSFTTKPYVVLLMTTNWPLTVSVVGVTRIFSGTLSEITELKEKSKYIFASPFTKFDVPLSCISPLVESTP